VPLKLNNEEWKEYIHALELFNSKYFWECHEVLEDIWMIKQPPLKTFLQGIIQAAAAFYHVLGENPKGTIKLAQDSLNKFEGFEKEHLGIDVAALRQSLSFFKNEAQEILDKKRDVFTLLEIPIIKIPESVA
jgi:predicted metal-dependent hydrolase